MASPKCDLCGHELRVTKAKNGKPFQLCSGCGLQILIRKDQGVALFEKKYGASYRGVTTAQPVAAAAKPKPAPAAGKETTREPKKETSSTPAGGEPKPRRGFFDFD